MGQNTTINVTGGGSLTGTGGGAGSPKSDFNIGSALFPAVALALGDGTGNGKANNLYVATRTLGAAGNDDLDLAGGLTNDLGQTLTFTKIKLILVVIDSPDGTKKLKVGQGAANPFLGPFVGTTPFVELYDAFLVANTWGGWTVTAATGDVMRVTNHSAVSVTYRILIVGET